MYSISICNVPCQFLYINNNCTRSYLYVHVHKCVQLFCVYMDVVRLYLLAKKI